jgi:hypothetical protein
MLVNIPAPCSIWVCFFVLVGFSSFESVCQATCRSRGFPPDAFFETVASHHRVSRFKHLQQDMGMGENHFKTYEITI